MGPTNASGYQFPDEYAPPKVKEKDAYGLQYGKAMYHCSNRFGYRMMTEDVQYNALVELAQGRQSVNNIRRLFGFHDRANSDPSDMGNGAMTNEDNGALAFVDIQVINLATKYVNRAVAKLQRVKYDLSLSAVDAVSVDEAKQHTAELNTFYLCKQWFEENSIDAQKYFPNLDLPNLPDYPEELMFRMSTNDKIKRVIDGEKTLKLVNTVMNDMQQVLRECDWDSVVIGREHIHCWLDENKMPRCKRINPKYWLGSYVENEDYRSQEYAGFIEFITRNQFKKEAENKLSQDEITEVLGSHAFPNAATSFGSLPDFYQNYDGLEYIPVLRFYFLSNDNVAYATWENEKGHRLIDERNYEYFPKQSDKKQRIIKNTYTSVYGGSWVVDSDIVYNYGRKDIPRTDLVNTRLPIISFAPNMKEGRIVSMLSQMIEPLTMFNVAWNKVKDILAKGRMGIYELNLTAFEGIALGKGGENWKPQEALDFLFQTNIAVTRQNTNQFGQSIGQAFRQSAAGLTIADYFTTMSQCVHMMDDLTGSSVVESPDLPDRLAVGAMKANIAAGSDSIEYLHNAHKQMYFQASHMMLLLAQEAKRNKVTIKGMIPALGKNTTEFFEVPDDLAYCEYGLHLEAAESPEQWAEFYAELAEAVKEGKLNASDSAFIRNIEDMKQARFIMANRETLNEKKAIAANAQQQQFQAQSAEAANQQKMQTELALQAKKQEDAKELMAIQAQIDSALMEKKAALDGEVNQVSHMVKEQIAKQQGIDTIIKEAMRSKAENYKADRQHESKIATADISARATLTAAQFVANKKEKAKQTSKTKK